MANLPSVDEASFKEKVLSSSKAVLVDFWAPWCGPCLMLEPILEKVAEDYKDYLEVYSLNTDENIEIASQYQIAGIPTLLLFLDGELKDRLIGYVPEQQLINFVEKNITKKV